MFRFRWIFLLQTVINISDAGCWRCVCRAAEPEVTKTGVNIYEAFSHQIFDNWRLRKGQKCVFFFRKTPFCQERINRKCQCWSRSCVCWPHSSTANNTLYIRVFFFLNLYHLISLPLHFHYLFIPPYCCSTPSSSIPLSSPHTVSLILTRASELISLSLTSPSISHPPASFHSSPPLPSLHPVAPAALHPSPWPTHPSSPPALLGSTLSFTLSPPISSSHTVQVR